MLLAMIIALPVSVPLSAQRPPVSAGEGRIASLKAGEYLWAPQVAPEGPVTIIVSLKTQKAYAYRNGVAIGVSSVSTGMKGFRTPTGVFTVLQKDADHVSNIYKDAAMPFMQRLTWRGIAMHAGNLPGYPASHGCIRMPLAFAKLLFGITNMGVTVVITQDAQVPLVVTTPGALKRDERTPVADADFVWNPALSPSGPVSIIISGRDRKVVVLRNGTEIGSSMIHLDVAIEETAAFTLQAVDERGEHWLRLPLPGQNRTGELSAEDRAKGRLPDRFRAALATVLTPGTTLLVMRESLAGAGTGKAVTVIEADQP
jgi:hypothetical protein